jgi:hypothetical protein
MTTKEQYKRAYSMVRTMRYAYPANINPATYAEIKADVMGNAFKSLLNSYLCDKWRQPFHYRSCHAHLENGKYVYVADGIPF